MAPHGADGTEMPLLLPSPAAGTTTPAGGGDAAPPRRNRFAFVCAMLASMTTMLHGYNLTLMSGAQLFMREDVGLTDAQVEVLAGSMNVFMLASILGGGWFADRLGRRRTLALANAFLMAGALAMSLGGSFAALMAARFVTSIGAGFARVVAPVYNAEIAPPSSRGALSSLLDVFINTGVLLSYVSNYAFSGLPVRLGWRVMYAVGAVPPVFIAAGVFLIMPESPRWLAMRGRHADARAVLVRTSDTADEADLRLAEIKQAVAHQRPPPLEAAAGSHGGVWKELLFRPSGSVRRILTCVIGLQFFVQASGIDAILLYGPLIFKAAGMSSNASVLGATVAIGAVKTRFIVMGMLFTDRLGRRPLLLTSTAGVAVTTASLAVTLRVGGTAPAPAACLASVLAVVAAYSVGYGSVVSTYSAEILPLRLRAQGASLGVAVNRLTCGLVGMTIVTGVPGTTDRGTTNRERERRFRCNFYTVGTISFPRSRSERTVPGTRNAASFPFRGDYGRDMLEMPWKSLECRLNILPAPWLSLMLVNSNFSSVGLHSTDHYELHKDVEFQSSANGVGQKSSQHKILILVFYGSEAFKAMTLSMKAKLQSVGFQELLSLLQSSDQDCKNFACSEVCKKHGILVVHFISLRPNCISSGGECHGLGGP